VRSSTGRSACGGRHGCSTCVHRAGMIFRSRARPPRPAGRPEARRTRRLAGSRRPPPSTGGTRPARRARATASPVRGEHCGHGADGGHGSAERGEPEQRPTDLSSKGRCGRSAVGGLEVLRRCDVGDEVTGPVSAGSSAGRRPRRARGGPSSPRSTLSVVDERLGGARRPAALQEGAPRRRGHACLDHAPPRRVVGTPSHLPWPRAGADVSAAAQTRQ
jgi:hypothetical protein